MTLSEQVFEIVKKIPKGKVTTYKIIADKLGTKAYRAIGQILKNNPNAPIVPCHRVVKSDGSVGGYFGKLIDQKIDLLISEGIKIKKGKVIGLERQLYIGD